MPWLIVNHTWLAGLSAVPTPLLAADVQRGSWPGQPGASGISLGVTLCGFMRVLVIDVGGTHVKVIASGVKEPIKIPSGPDLTPRRLVSAVRKATRDWQYDAISIGFPGPVVHGKLVSEPHNLGAGWIGFSFRKAFRRPVKVVNDAAM